MRISDWSSDVCSSDLHRIRTPTGRITLMCVKKVQAWDHAGKLFTTEEDALKAALKDIADLLMKDHSAKLHDGLLAVSPKLRSVLDRLAAIEKLKPVAAEPAARFVDDAVAEAA